MVSKLRLLLFLGIVAALTLLPVASASAQTFTCSQLIAFGLECEAEGGDADADGGDGGDGGIAIGGDGGDGGPGGLAAAIGIFALADASGGDGGRGGDADASGGDGGDAEAEGGDAEIGD